MFILGQGLRHKRMLAVAIVSCSILGVVLFYEFVYYPLWEAREQAMTNKIGRVYQQLFNYDNLGNSSRKMMPAIKMNYTIVLSNESADVENILTVCKWNMLPVARMEASFGDLKPDLIEGDLTWTGLMTYNETKIFNFKLALSTDGAYEMRGEINTTSLEGGEAPLEGIHLTYNLVVKEEKIIKVADEDGIDIAPSA